MAFQFVFVEERPSGSEVPAVELNQELSTEWVEVVSHKRIDGRCDFHVFDSTHVRRYDKVHRILSDDGSGSTVSRHEILSCPQGGPKTYPVELPQLQLFLFVCCLFILSVPMTLNNSHSASFGVMPTATHVLLAMYFIGAGRVSDATCHVKGAVDLTYSNAFHQIRSRKQSKTGNYVAPSIALTSDDVRIRILEGERIHAFWTVYKLHKQLAIHTATLTELWDLPESRQTVVDTPWPWDMHAYEKGLVPDSLRGDSTIDNFLNGIMDVGDLSIFSLDALSIKAGDVVEPTKFHGLYSSVRAIDDGVMIRLNGLIPDVALFSKCPCLLAALDMFSMGEVAIRSMSFIPSIMSCLWPLGCSTLIAELVCFRAESERTELFSPPGFESVVTEENLNVSLRCGLKVLEFFSDRCLLMAQSLRKLVEKCEEAGLSSVLQDDIHP
ncbi:hypothetical protein B0H10DRAFT_1939200 [Mycena sp. CBHHK59/15]|nr:hypothetical protein B0H10DRAFT_1939200 [Mycena sp. CBHHK59/15]